MISFNLRAISLLKVSVRVRPRSSVARSCQQGVVRRPDPQVGTFIVDLEDEVVE